MYGVLPPKGYVQSHVTSLILGNDNVSLTVKDRDIVAIEHLWEIVCGLSNGTIANALE